MHIVAYCSAVLRRAYPLLHGECSHWADGCIAWSQSHRTARSVTASQSLNVFDASSQRYVIRTRHGTGLGLLGHRVSGSFGSSFTSGSPGHHFDPAWDASFSSFRKNAENAKRTFEVLSDQLSHAEPMPYKSFSPNSYDIVRQRVVRVHRRQLILAYIVA